jgi:hypothetical protein
VSRRLPPAARPVFEEGVLCNLSVTTPLGPHLTPVVFVLDGGRLWVTTSRSSVKAMAWRRDPTATGLVEASGLAVTFRGRVRTYDVLDPLSWPKAAVAGPRLVSAATRFSLKNARFFAGYAVDARRVPFAWSPPGRLFAGVEMVAGRVLRPATGEVVDGWGEWPMGVRYEPAYGAHDEARRPHARIPSSVRTAVGRSGTAALALGSRHGGAVLPVAWRRADGGVYEAVAPARFLRLAHADRGAPSALTISHASRWRAADMAGLLVRGRAALYHPRRASRGAARIRKRLASGWEGVGWGDALDGVGWDDAVLVQLRPTLVVWWQGWTSGTVRT